MPRCGISILSCCTSSPTGAFSESLLASNSFRFRFAKYVSKWLFLQAPSSLLDALEQHLASLEGKKIKDSTAASRCLCPHLFKQLSNVNSIIFHFIIN